MSKIQTQHPSKEVLAAFVHGRLSPVEQTEIERHIAGCASCCKALEAVPDDTLLGNMKAGHTPLDPFAGLEHNAPMGDVEHLPPELREHPRYRIFKLLGKGGMGEVYLAEHRLMERMVALKVIKRTITQDAQAVDRFRTEVRAAARLTHPNIVTAHDAEQAGDVHFLVMEYIEGVSLARLVEQRGHLAIRQACEYVRQAALGLQHAFEHGMIHRDIKPQNLMLTRKGQIKILDFGLARFARDPAAGRITELGAVLGTPDYIAPEQVTDARHADIRADIYSLGCTFYYLLAGQTPFPSGTHTQKIIAHVDHAPQSLERVRSQVPVKVIALIARMMAKDPAERFQTPGAVAQALEPFCKTDRREDPVAEAPRKASPTPSIKTTPMRKPLTRPAARLQKRWLMLAVIPAAFLLLAFCVVAAVVLWLNRGPEPGKEKGANPLIIVDNKKPTTPRVLIVLTHQGFWDQDYRPVRGMLEQKGIEVKVASTEKTPAEPHDRRFGGPVPVDLLIEDARPVDFEAIFFAGARSLDYVGDKPGAASARKLIIESLAAEKIVSAQCAGVAVLADAGVLKGKPAAWTNHLYQTSVRETDALWDKQQPVVTSGNIITGGHFDHAPKLAAALIQRLTKNP